MRVRYVTLPRMPQDAFAERCGCGVTAGPRARSPGCGISLRIDYRRLPLAQATGVFGARSLAW